MKLGNNNNKNLPWKTNKPSKEWYMRDLCALYMSQSYEVYTLYMWQSYEVYTVYMWQSYEVYTVYMWQSYEVYTLYKCNNHTQLTHTLYTKCNFFLNKKIDIYNIVKKIQFPFVFFSNTIIGQNSVKLTKTDRYERKSCSTEHKLNDLNETREEEETTFKVVISLATSKPNQHWSLHRLTCVVPLY